MIASWREIYDKSRQCVEKQRHYFSDKGLYSQGYGLPSGHERLWELGCKESRVTKNWCLWTVVLEKTPESPLDFKEIKTVSLKGNQPWILIGRTDAEAEEALVFWSPDANSNSLKKSLMLGKIEGIRRGGHQDEMAGWHHWCNEHELGQTSGDGEGQGGLVCCSPWDHRVGHDWVTEQQHLCYSSKYSSSYGLRLTYRNMDCMVW